MNLTKVFLALALLATFVACAGPSSQSLSGDDSGEQVGVMGGETVRPQDPVASYVVGLYDEVHHSSCTGSILSDRLILTAAHCVVPGTSRIRIVFDQKLFKGSGGDRSRTVMADSYMRHPQSRDDHMDGDDTYDLALVRFSGGLPSGFRKVELDSNYLSQIRGGTPLLAVGFGVSSGAFKTGSGILRSAYVPFSKLHAITELETLQSPSGVCSGDSGGPLFQEAGGRLIQVGVASRVDRYTLFCGGFAVFTRVDVYSAWLSQFLGN